MTFNDDAQLDTSGVSRGGGGGGRGLALGGGGGILGLIVLVIYMLMGGNPGDLQQPPTQAEQQAQAGAGDLAEKCRTGADANSDPECRVVATRNSVQAFWREEIPKASGGKQQWQDTKMVLYHGQTPSGCGTANNEVGPFYCPLDKTVYLDAAFFRILEQQFGSSGGPLAQEYVVAHEYGHALQDQLGLLERAQQDPKGPESGGVKTELMADCFAGMWAKGAVESKDANGRAFMQPLTEKDVRDALSAAEAVGDDHIQEQARGRVNPESFTHGTSAQRQQWFMRGYESGDINQCNTFRASRL
ncbi:KPN_02809 family neutral zinc metallopeptidase [Mobilicoccus pelagius]|uniref:Metalloprotease n=1 Tax=Mobilicoccus pelagius NBRC 104925 TaxID=1089455 RepID=H5UTK6_9MICO|nr:neutral zinc metallopeptidase [Mobilicoccus pelagius]GAB49064.1 hypothetical protein MOPEL_096_00710 [Mobilicoccus pelagius NBRC 104925]